MEAFEAGRYNVKVLYLDNHLLGVEKPVNMPVQADSSGDMDLLTACKGFVKRRFDKPGDVYLGLVHRLDRPVGGAMVFARTSKAAARLSKQFAGHDVDKTYLCVVRGDLTDPLDLSDHLLKDEKTGMVRIVSEGAPGAKLARLYTEPVARADNLTLCKVKLYTGRSHQIRVQHAHAGLPLWGDNRYGGGIPGQQLALWAHHLVVEHPTQGIPVELTSQPPLDTSPWNTFHRAIMEMHA